LPVITQGFVAEEVLVCQAMVQVGQECPTYGCSAGVVRELVVGDAHPTRIGCQAQVPDLRGFPRLRFGLVWDRE